MTAMDALHRLCVALQAALPSAAVVSVHAQDLSDANTGKWLVRLPGIYLTCDGIDVDDPSQAVVRVHIYVLARLADVRRQSAASGWALAEGALAVVAADVFVRRARMVYRDQAGLDQPGVALWEITAECRHVLDSAAGVADGWRAETLLASWAPWIGAAHEPMYRPIAADVPDPGETLDGMLP